MKTLIRLSILLAIISISCAKAPQSSDQLNDETTISTSTNKGIEDISVSSSFDWKTYKNVNLNLTGKSKSLVEVTSSNGTVYQKAYLSNDTYKMKISVPTYEKTLKLIYMGQNISLDISSGNIAHVFE